MGTPGEGAWRARGPIPDSRSKQEPGTTLAQAAHRLMAFLGPQIREVYDVDRIAFIPSPRLPLPRGCSLPFVEPCSASHPGSPFRTPAPPWPGPRSPHPKAPQSMPPNTSSSLAVAGPVFCLHRSWWPCAPITADSHQSLSSQACSAPVPAHPVFTPAAPSLEAQSHSHPPQAEAYEHPWPND